MTHSMIYIYNVGGNIIALIKSEKTHTTREPLPYFHFDQLIYWREDSATTHIEIYNRDFSCAKQCGNGLSALAHHLQASKLNVMVNKKNYCIQKIKKDYWVDMGSPTIQQLDPQLFEVDIGNRHIVSLHHILQPSLIQQWSMTHNVSFICLHVPGVFSIKTYERGCGYTGSCASASTAASSVLQRSFPEKQHWTAYNPQGMIQIKKYDTGWKQCATSFLERTIPFSTGI